MGARRRGAVSRAAVSCSAVAVAGSLLAAPIAAAPPIGAGWMPFQHVGSFEVPRNLVASGEPSTLPTSAEIVAATADGDTLVYTDAYTGSLGFVDVRDPAAPVALGLLELPGDPTSVAVVGGHALVAVVTSSDPDGDGPLTSHDAPSGDLIVVDLATRATTRTIALAGQPDSVAVAPSGRFAAIVIENERDEDENDGLIPQLPGGALQVLSIDGAPADWTLRTVSLTGLATVAPSDPEPEYVDINRRDEAVVSLQENNHLVIVDLRRARVLRHFTAGTADIVDVDTVEEEIGPQENGLIDLSGSLPGRRREPDSVAWIDDRRFATANEGDYEDATGTIGGSRSFTIFSDTGRVLFEAGAAFEHEIVRAGHYPEGRSENKGNEPEGLEVGEVGGRTLLFVAAERANVVGVYDVSRNEPVFLQLLPTAIGPEGLTLTADGVLAVTSEVDGADPDEGFLARPIVTLFSTHGTGAWSYPQLASADVAGLPIPWVAMSGLAGDPDDPGILWAVSDSVLGQAWLYRIDTSATPAVIRERIAIGATGVTDQAFGDYDLEGVAARPGGGFWFASEGRTSAGSSRPNLLVRTSASGVVEAAYRLPAELAATATSSGFEGVTVTGSAQTGTETVWLAIQRPWSGDAGRAKIARFDVATAAWSFAHYPLDAAPAVSGAVVGLSEITGLPDGRLAIIERDNQLGSLATVKRVYAIDPSSVTFRAYGTALDVLEKTLLRDVLPDLDAASISVPDKLEGLGVAADGQVYLVTDNDGVDDIYGETLFLRLGSVADAFDG